MEKNHSQTQPAVSGKPKKRRLTLRNLIKATLPLIIVGTSAIAAYSLALTASEPEPRPVEAWKPLVEVMPAERRTVHLDVETYGSVQPRTEIALSPQVSGRIEYVSPNLKNGGFFTQNEVLVRLESREYELAITQAQSVVAQAEATLDRESAEAEIARKEWERYGEGDADPLVLRKPQLAEAEARLASAKAALERARLDLERTWIEAPFNGRVVRQEVDLGQYVTVGSVMGTIHATDYVEVRLEVPADQLEFLDLPLCGANAAPVCGARSETRSHIESVVSPDANPDMQSPTKIDARSCGAQAAHPTSLHEVQLEAVYGSDQVRWTGRLVRTEAEVDPRTRVVRALVRVDEPYRTDPPLMKGMYVKAVIPGREVRDAVVLPRRLVRPSNQVYIVGSDHCLSIRTCEPLKKERDRVIFASGIEAGEWICVTDVHPAIEGMEVRVAGTEETDRTQVLGWKE